MKLTAICLTFFFLFCGILFCQSEERTVFLHHADSLVGKELNGEPARLLYGNIKFTQGSITVTCDHAIQYLNSNKLILIGDVVIEDDTIRIVTHRGMYYGESKIAEAFDQVRLDDGVTVLKANYGKYFAEEKKIYFSNNVLVQDSVNTLSADELTYFRDSMKTTARGNVVITDLKGNITITGNHFENYKQEKYSIMTQQPRAIQINTTTDGEIDTLIVTSEIMESFQDTLENLVATNNVSIEYNRFVANAEKCTYYTKLDSIILTQNPIIWYTVSVWETTQVAGDSMFLKLNNRRPEVLNVNGNTFVITRADSIFPERFNQLTGQRMSIWFSKNTISRIEVYKTATMVYYLFENNLANGLNMTTSDQVTIEFLDQKIDKIRVIGGVEGKYFPENMVRGKESEYNLPGFQWKTDQQRRSIMSQNR